MVWLSDVDSGIRIHLSFIALLTVIIRVRTNLISHQFFALCFHRTMDVWKRIKRKGRQASKFQFTVSYHDLNVRCSKTKW